MKYFKYSDFNLNLKILYQRENRRHGTIVLNKKPLVKPIFMNSLCHIHRKAFTGLIFALFYLQFTSSSWGGYLPASKTHLVQQGAELRQKGEINRAISVLADAMTSSTSAEMLVQAKAEMALTLYQAHRYEAATPLFLELYQTAKGSSKAIQAIYLGNISILTGKKAVAKQYYEEALNFSKEDIDTELTAKFNLIRLLPKEKKQAALAGLAIEVSDEPRLKDPANFHLNIGEQYRLLGDSYVAEAYKHLEQACRQAEISESTLTVIEAKNALAQLYEDQGRYEDSLNINLANLAEARKHSLSQTGLLVIRMEWRSGKLYKALHRDSEAYAAYQRTMAEIEALREDLPMEDNEGNSIFLSLIRPIYMDYIEQVLSRSKGGLVTEQHSVSKIIDTIELLRQKEMQDFMGDRCSIDDIRGNSSVKIPPGTAVMYPLIYPDRIELFLQTKDKKLREVSLVDSQKIQFRVAQLTKSLREGEGDYLTPARALYNWILKPIAADLEKENISNLVIVPDGPIRMLPLGVLNDGKSFAIEKYSISVTTGISMTQISLPAIEVRETLVAGLSEPGPVVNKLSDFMSKQILQPSNTAARGLRQIKGSRSLSTGLNTATRSSSKSLEELRSSLALPGVKDEVATIADLMGANLLLDADFTAEQFTQKTSSAQFQILHIATHGVFGGNAHSSFLLAFDELITMNRLETLLRGEGLQSKPIDLLTLSACETAEGNERAPLGISGAAIKARARSVVGTLWPVNDEAAQNLMKSFYRQLKEKKSKTTALRKAQLDMIRNPEWSHPFYWAPFVLIGNWM